MTDGRAEFDARATTSEPGVGPPDSTGDAERTSRTARPATAPTPSTPPTLALPEDDARTRTVRRPAKPKRGLIGRLLRLALMLGLALILLAVALIGFYRFVDPPLSTLMLGESVLGRPVHQTWVPIERISPRLIRAVVVSEDGRFCQHGGIDWQAMSIAIDQARDGIPRGASTITMQTAKNLFLWPGKSYLRKALEIPLALGMEAAWPKRRILEIYLNIAEWGPGIYGIEAASRFHFAKPASQLTDREALLLAVSLPNPIRRRAGRPGPGTTRLARRLALRLPNAGPVLACLALPRDKRVTPPR
ncbi:MAG: monofunctional biosynthetic peptidoglycan transglycosylase [Hyphomicrobiaceae bacterium]